MNAQAPILELRDVAVRFGGLRAVDGASLAVLSGQVTSLIGPNGAGKTTIFNLVCGLLTPSAGQILFRGRPIVGMSPHAIAQLGIGRTFQDPRVYRQMTALENVLLGMPGQEGERLLPALLWPRSMRRDLARRVERGHAILAGIGLAGQANQLAADLSYGQQRFLSLARVLAMDAPLLLMDEPTVGLHRGEVQHLLEQISRLVREERRTVVLIEHNMDAVMSISDQIGLLVAGKIVATGSPTELQQNQTLIDAYLGTRTVPIAQELASGA